MNRMHKITLVAAAATLFALGCGGAMAQTAGSEYEQGYAAGAAAQHKNSFDAYDSGLEAGKEQQTASAQAYNRGYQAGLAQKNAQGEQAYNQAYNNGYQDGANRDYDSTNRAFDNGFRMGADAQAHNDEDYP